APILNGISGIIMAAKSKPGDTPAMAGMPAAPVPTAFNPYDASAMQQYLRAQKTAATPAQPAPAPRPSPVTSPPGPGAAARAGAAGHDATDTRHRGTGAELLAQGCGRTRGSGLHHRAERRSYVRDDRAANPDRRNPCSDRACEEH